MLRPLLERLATHLQHAPASDAAAAQLLATLRRTLSQPSQQGYRNVTSLSAEVSELRARVCESLEYLLPRKEQLDERGLQLHQDLHQYMAWEVRQEARVIDPAFEGFGPRR